MRLIATLVLIVVGAFSLSAQDVGLEYRVKAAYLLNFTRFVEWPPQALQNARAFQICIAGRNPFGSELAALVTGEKVAGLPLTARVVEANDATACHVLFVPRDTPAAPYLRAVMTAPVLTVGESGDFLAQGGDINFFLDNCRVRFEIDQASAERVQVKISSRLLQLGRPVAARANE
jgi:hypothetical protein